MMKQDADKPMLEYLGKTPCPTPACGLENGTNGPADLVRVGKFVKIVCQRCGACHALSERDVRELVAQGVRT